MVVGGGVAPAITAYSYCKGKKPGMARGWWDRTYTVCKLLAGSVHLPYCSGGIDNNYVAYTCFDLLSY